MGRWRRSRVLAAVVLCAIALTAAALLRTIALLEPGGLSAGLYLPGVLATAAFAAVLLASRRWESVWERGFVPSVPLPGWLPVAAGALALVSIALSAAGRVPLAAVPWLALGCAGATWAASAATGGALPPVERWPAWLVLAGLAAVVTAVGVSVALAGSAALTVVFLVALLLFAFHVCFVLPLTLYHAVAVEGTTGTAPNNAYAAADATDLNETAAAQGADAADDVDAAADDAVHATRGADVADDAAAADDAPDASALPDVSVVVPAYDEEGFVGECLETILGSNYPEDAMEVVVVDDGSTDGTYEEAARYRDRGVRVVHRENGGKHAALNMGLQCTSAPIVATVDADSRPLPDALGRAVRALAADPEVGALSASVVTCGGGGHLVRLQRLEYALSNTSRRAYSLFGAVPVVPGCLGVYRREALADVWGYDPSTVTEDFDVTVQLLRSGWEVRHGPGTVATAVPQSWRALWRQRLRWYRGGLETLRKHCDVLRSPRYGYLHALSLPTRLSAQLFGPVASLVILGAVVWGLLTGPSTYLLALVGLFFVLTVLIALFSVLLEDEPLSLVAYAPLLFVGYKHFVDCTVGVGTVRAALAGRTRGARGRPSRDRPSRHRPSRDRPSRDRPPRDRPSRDG